MISYLLPWLVATSAPLTLNAYDLAEWVSLHPSQRHTSPPLMATLLLRLQLLMLSVMLGALPANKPWKLASAILIVLLAIAQLPPLEFVLDPGNLNYRQQFGLALASLFFGMLFLRFLRPRLRSIALIALPMVGIVSALMGMSRALEVFAVLQVDGATGLGMWLLIASYLGCLALALLSYARRLRAGSLDRLRRESAPVYIARYRPHPPAPSPTSKRGGVEPPGSNGFCVGGGKVGRVSTACDAASRKEKRRRMPPS